MCSQFYNTNKALGTEKVKELIREFHDPATSRARTLDIRHGAGSGEKFTNHLKEKAKTKITISSLEYWTNKGFSPEEAIVQKKQFYATNNVKATAASLEWLAADPIRKAKKYKGISETKRKRRNPQYWLDLGCSTEEAKTKVSKLMPPRHDLAAFIERFGEEDGPKRQEQRYLKQRQTTLDRYGRSVISGYVSKASIRFFKPLYRALRKSGIERSDIVWGIGGRREFTTKDKSDGKNVAYDFVVKSKKIIVEYNDPFWHAREKGEWRNPIVQYEASKERDEHKHQIAKTLGFDIIYVWADNLPEIDQLKSEILSHEQ